MGPVGAPAAVGGGPQPGCGGAGAWRKSGCGGGGAAPKWGSRKLPRGRSRWCTTVGVSAGGTGPAASGGTRRTVGPVSASSSAASGCGRPDSLRRASSGSVTTPVSATRAGRCVRWPDGVGSKSLGTAISGGRSDGARAANATRVGGGAGWRGRVRLRFSTAARRREDSLPAGRRFGDRVGRRCSALAEICASDDSGRCAGGWIGAVRGSGALVVSPVAKAFAPSDVDRLGWTRQRCDEYVVTSEASHVVVRRGQKGTS